MGVPEDFQFAHDSDIDAFAVKRAELLFGKDWKNRADLEISHSSIGTLVVSDKQSEWSLHIIPATLTNSVSVACKKHTLFEDPAPNIAAFVGFHQNGHAANQSHYLGDRSFNPPDGTPACIHYGENGNVSDCWYVNKEGLLTRPVSQEEIDERIAAAKRSTIASLCGDSQEIVALKIGATCSRSRGENSPSNSSGLKL